MKPARIKTDPSWLAYVIGAAAGIVFGLMLGWAA